jgi:NADH-quinone oxidoreductase subunit E
MSPGPNSPGAAVQFSEAQLGAPPTVQQLADAMQLPVRKIRIIKRGALLPVLHMAQATFGWISLPTEEYVAGLFDLSPAHVHEVVTFYTLYFQQPKGRHVVAVCHNLSCYLAGAKDLLAHVKSRLGVEVASLSDTDNLYGAGMTSHASVTVMLACEDEWDLEFPQQMLKKSTFASVANIRDALGELGVDDASVASA